MKGLAIRIFEDLPEILRGACPVTFFVTIKRRLVCTMAVKEVR
jgi:hypothetical protein